MREIHRFWTAEEDKVLRSMWPQQNSRQIAEAMGRSVPSVCGRLHFLKMRISSRKPKLWSKEDDALLIKLLEKEKFTTKIAPILGRTVHAVNCRIDRLDLHGHRKHPYKTWDKQEVYRLMVLSEKKSPDEIAKKMGRTRESVYRKMYELGLSAKTSAFSLARAAEHTGYHYTQLERARDALSQKWHWAAYRPGRNRAKGQYKISEEQLEELVEYLGQETKVVYEKQQAKEKTKCVRRSSRTSASSPKSRPSAPHAPASTSVPSSSPTTSASSPPATTAPSPGPSTATTPARAA